MSQKIYLYILRFGIYLVLISFFLVFKSFLFPFITSKQIYFNILIELLFAIWLAFIIKYPSWRPKKSWITIGLISFFTVLLISSFTGVDFNLSFWGDIERMLGWFHLVHFLIFYLIIITVMRTWQDWQKLLILSVIASVFISFYAMSKEPFYATIGNTAYVSGLVIFNIYFALILFFRSFREGQFWDKNWIVRVSYLGAALVNFLALGFTRTRGAYVGLGVSVFILLLLLGLLYKNKKIKIYSLAALVVISILVSLVFIYPDSNIVQDNTFLRRLTQINFQDDTLQTRFISWRAAWYDFSDHPIFGTGHGNFAITFDKYFDPIFYIYTQSETYFDRAHNNLVDIASTSGILGLLAYLSIFTAAGYYLIKGYKRKRIVLLDFILIVSLIIAYFIQNLAVFDSLVTYVSLMIMLGFIYWLSKGEAEIKHEEDKNYENKEIYILLGVGLVMLTVIYQFNYKPIKMLKNTIDGQIALGSNDIVTAVEEYKEALKYNTGLDRDSRNSLVRSIVSNPNIFAGVNNLKSQEILEYVKELAEKNVALNPGDSLSQMMLSQFLNVTANFYGDNPEKFTYYSNLSLDAIDKSIAASPRRVPIYYSKAQIYLTRGEKEKAIETLEYALGLNELYPDSHCQLGRVYLFYQMEEEGFKRIDSCLDLGGERKLSPSGFVSMLLDHYIETSEWGKVIKLYEQLARLEPKNAQILVNLAKIYAQEGEPDKAREAAQKAVEIDPTLKRGANEFIDSLE